MFDKQFAKKQDAKLNVLYNKNTKQFFSELAKHLGQTVEQVLQHSIKTLSFEIQCLKDSLNNLLNRKDYWVYNEEIKLVKDTLEAKKVKLQKYKLILKDLCSDELTKKEKV